MLQFLSVKSGIDTYAALYFLFINDSPGGLSYKPGGFLKSLRHNPDFLN